jgi:tetratricopeptide (TPR) repeat protein
MSSTYYLAWSYLDLKKYPEAISLLKDCVRQQPKAANLYVAMAEGYYRMKDLKEALSSAQMATQVSPDSQAGYASQGFIYFEMKKVKEARRLFEKAVSLAPSSGSARYNLAMTCLAMKQKNCAQEQYAILKTSEPELSTQLLDLIYSDKVIRLVK